MDSLPINHLALRLAEESPIPDPLLLWASNLNLTEHGHMTADPKLALCHAQKCLEIIEQYPDVTSRSQHFGIAYLTYVELAEAYMGHHQWEKAIELCDIAIQKKATDGTRRCAANAVVDKAHCIARLGRADEAWEKLDTFLSKRESEFGPAQPWKFVFPIMYNGALIICLRLSRAALCLVEQGNVARAQGREEDSFGYFQKAYATWLDLFGRGHFRVAALATKLGEHYHRIGKLSKAK